MFGKAEIKEFLEENKIPFTWVEHQAVYTIDEMKELGLEEEGRVAKNLFLRDAKGKRHFLVVISGEKQTDLKAFGERFGLGRLSFASEERLEKYLALKKGAVTPLGVLNDEQKAVEVFFDEELCGLDCIGVHPNDNTASVFLKPEDLLEILRKNGTTVHVEAFSG